MPERLTKRVVDSMRPTAAGSEVFAWCGELRGFGVRCKPSGHKTFIVQYRNDMGRTRRMALGAYGRLTVDQARSLAKVHLGNVETGSDPSRDRQERRDSMTVSDLCDFYLTEARAGRVTHKGKIKKASTLYTDDSRIRRHIKPLLGCMTLNEVDRKDVYGMLAAVTAGKTSIDVRTRPRGRARVRGGKGTAVKCVTLLSAMFNFAIRRGLADINPCLGIEKPGDVRRTRFLSPDEYARLGAALRDCMLHGVSQTAANAIYALALTGCRKGEILNLRKSSVDKDGRCLRLADTKTGAQLRPCGEVALKFLAAIADRLKDDDDYLFPALRGEGPLINIRKPFDAICAVAEIDGATPHTLRHSYATCAHELNYSELTIAGLLGHRAGSVTARYAHNVDQVLAAVASVVSLRIWNCLRAEKISA